MPAMPMTVPVATEHQGGSCVGSRCCHCELFPDDLPMRPQVHLLDHGSGVWNVKIKDTNHMVTKLELNRKMLSFWNFKIEACIEGGVEAPGASSRVQVTFRGIFPVLYIPLRGVVQ